MGLYPDGVEPDETVRNAKEGKAPAASAVGQTLKESMGTAVFWLLGISFLLNGFAHMGVLQNTVPYLRDIGFPIVAAAGAISVVGFLSLIPGFRVCSQTASRKANIVG
jgi:hypothetical protein